MKSLFLVILALLMFGSSPMAVLAQSMDVIVTTNPTPVPISAAKQPIQQELERVVAEMVDSGHMKQTKIHWGFAGQSSIYYLTPSDTIYTLSAAYPYLSTTLKARVKTYLDSEIATYPPHSVKEFPTTAGAAREYFDASTTSTYNIWPGPSIHSSVLYSVWAYAYSTGSWNYVQTNYAALKSLYTSLKSAGIRTYPDLAGAIGFARIAKQLNNTADYSDALSFATAGYSTASNFATLLANSKSQYGLTGAHDYSVTLFQTNKYGRSFHFNRDLGTVIKAQAQTAATSHKDQICTDVPLCWLTAPGISYGENTYAPPEIAWTYMMLSSYVANRPFDELALKLDRPLRKGDLLYMQNLIAVLETSDSGTAPSPTPSGSPAACPTDFNGDGITEISDYNQLVSSLLKFPIPYPKTDIDKTGLTDLSDYNLFVPNFLKSCGT